MQTEELFALVFALVVFAGVFIVYLGLRQRSLQLEMRHKERMAMIERGMTPVADVTEGLRHVARGPSSRSMTLGIVIVAIGLGLMTVISIAAEAPGTGIGLGGGIAIIGAAFIVNSLINRGSATTQPSRPPSGE